jgi:hypothetical protein
MHHSSYLFNDTVMFVSPYLIFKVVTTNEGTIIFPHINYLYVVTIVFIVNYVIVL